MTLDADKTIYVVVKEQDGTVDLLLPEALASYAV